MSKVRRSLVTLAIGVAVLSPRPTSAQIILPQQQCVWSYLTACATLHYINFSGNTITAIVSNDTDPVVQPGNFIGTILFDLSTSTPSWVPNFQDAFADATYGTIDAMGNFVAGSDAEKWKVKDPTGSVGGFNSLDWEMELDDNASPPDGGVNSFRLYGGQAVMLVIDFATSLPTDLQLADCGDCADGGPWSAQIQTLGVDGNGSGFTTIPEPVTVTLLGSGLLGLAGAGAMRRRRRGSDIETP